MTSTRTATATFTPTLTPVPNIRQLPWRSSLRNPRISGDGSVLLYDNGTNVYLVTTEGRNERALTNVPSNESCWKPAPSTGGNRVVMVCTADVTGQNPDENAEIVLLDRTDFVAITRSPNTVSNGDPAISADGRTIVFRSNANYTGENIDGTDEIFLWREGQPLRQVSRGSTGSGNPSVSSDGQRVLYRQRQTGSLDNDSGESSYQLYDARTDATTEVIPAGSAYGAPRLSRDGQWVLFVSRADLVGSNANRCEQLYAQRVGGALRQLTANGCQTSVSGFATNGNASRMAVVLKWREPSSPQTWTGESILFTNSGSRPLPGVPWDASSLSFDDTGRMLAFISSQDPIRENPSHQTRLFVAVIALESDTPTPTRTPTRTPAPATLAQGMGPGDSTIVLTDARMLPTSGVVRIDDELITYRGRSDTELRYLTRGACGTTAASHNAAAAVILVPGGCAPTPTPTPSATPTPPPGTPGACTGDCGGDGRVTVDELVKGVNIALGNMPLDRCPRFDANGNGRVTIDELVKAVNAALNGCVG